MHEYSISMYILFEGLKVPYGLQNTSENIICTIANNKSGKPTQSSFQIVCPGADTCVDL